MIKYGHIAGSILMMLIKTANTQPSLTDMVKLRTAAEQWTSIIIKQNGHWHGSPAVAVQEPRAVQQDHRVLGFVCHVKPSGFILLAPNEELCPVKAYSTTADFKEESRAAEFLKTEMQDLIAAREGRLFKGAGSESSIAKSEWTMLLDGTMSRQVQNQHEQTANYDAGEELLQTAWDQCYPYNERCPLSCSGAPGSHAYAGCVAVAAAQVMRFWQWPPYRNNMDGKTLYYDWPHMMEWCQYDYGINRWLDEAGKPISTKNIDAVATLCYQAGAAAATRYGCDKSQAWIADQPDKDMLDGLRDEFFYHDNMTFKRHNVIEPVDWFNLIKKEINENRPVLCATQHSVLGGHCLVIDGWQEIGPTPIRMYHVNLGMGPFETNIWCAIEAVPYSRYYESETMVIGIKPAQSLGPALGGVYESASFPYRYVDQNAMGEKADFAAGQNIQFLAGMQVACKSGSGAAVSWAGRPEAQTLLFSKGNRHRGIKLVNSKIVLRNRGHIRFVR